METFLIIVAFCGVFLICWAGRECGTYRAGRNPAQRVCVDCGQEQWAYCHTIDSWDHHWWEASEPIKNPKCKCHKDVKTTNPKEKK